MNKRRQRTLQGPILQSNIMVVIVTYSDNLLFFFFSIHPFTDQMAEKARH